MNLLLLGAHWEQQTWASLSGWNNWIFMIPWTWIQRWLFLAWINESVILEEKLFDFSDHHGARKTIFLPNNDEDIKITIYAGEEVVREFVTKGVPDWKEKHKNDNITGEPNLVIDFVMSSVHIADIKDIYLNVTLNVTSVREKVEYVDEEVEI